MLSDHAITANDDGNVYSGHSVSAGMGSGSKPSSERSSATGSYRMAMENIIDEYSGCELFAKSLGVSGARPGENVSTKGQQTFA